jgi:hypothetical protein
VGREDGLVLRGKAAHVCHAVTMEL